ncbi:MAG: pantoate--beta-alanine ligase [Flavobacteriales bacterium]
METASIVERITLPTHMAERSAAARRAGGRVGFVPTMGALHEGHMDLIRQARKSTDLVVCSIFVNPLQFNDPRDLANYPRQLEQDAALLSDAQCDVLFAPTKEELFHAFEPRTYDLGGLDGHWEGPSRPGHFQGVVNVVERLFFHVRPDMAFFGEKDRQQLTILRHVARHERWPERIVPCPTVRAADGLALSSRNQRLSAEERAQATVLHRALQRAAELAFQFPPAHLHKAVADVLAEEPAVRSDHFGVADALDLQPLEEWGDRTEAVALIAAYVGPVRLIDNITLVRPTVPRGGPTFAARSREHPGATNG